MFWNDFFFISKKGRKFHFFLTHIFGHLIFNFRVGGEILKNWILLTECIRGHSQTKFTYFGPFLPSPLVNLYSNHDIPCSPLPHCCKHSFWVDPCVICFLSTYVISKNTNRFFLPNSLVFIPVKIIISERWYSFRTSMSYP